MSGLTKLWAFASLALLSAVLGCLGCSVEADGTAPRREPTSGTGAGASSGGGTGAPAPSSYSAELQPIGESRLLLSFGQEQEVAVQVFDRDGDPLDDAVVAFDLVGRPQDASLSALSVSTDEQGIARVTLRAGQRTATFELRASTLDALSISFNVAIGGAGFGTLIVHAPYDGDRSISERLVLAYPDLECGDVTPSSAEPSIVIAPGEDSAELIALPAEVQYAIFALGVGARDTIVTQDCAQGVTVLAGMDIEVEMAFKDAALVPAETLELEMQLEAGEVAATLAVAIRRAGQTLVRSDALGQNATAGAEGRFWLDSLDAALRADNATTAQEQLASALQSARATPSATSPDASLSTFIDLSGEGAQLAAAAMADHVRASLATLALHAQLDIAPGATLEVELSPRRLIGLAVHEASEPPSVDLTADEVTSVDAELKPKRDALDLHELTLSPRFGALALQALTQVVAPGSNGFTAELTQVSGCTSLTEWLADQSFVNAAACDATCVTRACNQSLARLFEAAATELDALDVTRSVVSFSGTLELSDEDGDLVAERMSSDDIAGVWLPEPSASLADSLLGGAQAIATSLELPQ